LLGEAAAIGDRLLSTALFGTNGTASWITRSFDPNTRQWQLKPMEISLYDGLAGPLIFLAALAKATGERRFRDGALAAFSTIRAGIYAPLAQYRQSIGVGLGIDSVIYSLVRVAAFLDEPGLLNDGSRLAREVQLPPDGSEDVLDLMGGCAGRILALLALRSSSIGEDWMLDRAIECGERLLQRRSAGPCRQRAWKTLRNRLQTGFAHGAAGISYALARLSVAVSNADYLEAANEACRFEDRLFNTEAQNWPGVGDGGSLFLQTRWCYGAPGIGLGRLGMLSAVRGSGQPAQWIYKDLYSALRTTLGAPDGALDHVCCGNLSRVELLLVASEKLGAPEWRPRALRLASSVIHRARLSGSYAMGIDPNLFLPSFHQGMAGVGYQFLRLAQPGQFPSVLLWE
jgi:type 2 lantibiotic biosynthesis protein LanM